VSHLDRNAAESLPQGELDRKLALGRPLRVKLGIDPTSPDIHLGHTVVLQKLREFQDAGHKVVLIIGDYTGRVGDPSGRSSTRPELSGEEIDANGRTYVEQARLVLDDDPERLEVRHNGEWLDMPMERLFRLVRLVTVAQLLERNDFRERYASGVPLSLLELLYPVMQGYDSVAIEADVELGGTDQTFNLMLGRDLQRAHGQAPQAVLTMPILVGLDGERKMSKTYGNQVGVTDPPAEMYGKVLSLPDAAMAQWFSLLLGEEVPADVPPRDAKHALAHRLVARLHGAEAAEGAALEFEQTFVRRELPDDIPDLELTDGDVHLPAVIAGAFDLSRSEARRALAGGGVKLDGEALAADALDWPAAELDGRVLQVGKRRFRRLRYSARPG